MLKRPTYVKAFAISDITHPVVAMETGTPTTMLQMQTPLTPQTEVQNSRKLTAGEKGVGVHREGEIIREHCVSRYFYLF